MTCFTNSKCYQDEALFSIEYPELFKDVCSGGINNDLERLVFSVQTALIQYLLQTNSNARESQEKVKVKNSLVRAWQGTGRERSYTSQVEEHIKLFTYLSETLSDYNTLKAKQQQDDKCSFVAFSVSHPIIADAVERISKRIKGFAKLKQFNAIY